MGVKIRVTTVLTVRTEIPLDAAHFEATDVDSAIKEELARERDDIISDFVTAIEIGDYEFVRYVSSIMEDERDDRHFIQEGNHATS
jgi:hypothetical protein